MHRRIPILLSVPLALAAAGSTPARGQSVPPAASTASAPVRTPDEEAELAIRLADIGRADDAMAFAQSAAARAPRDALPLLAMGVALDAIGQTAAAIGKLTEYTARPEGKYKDWRGHARLGRLYVRMQKPRLALAELEQAEPLIPPNDVVSRAFFLGDKADAQAALKDRKYLEDARASINQMFAILERSPEARSEPRLWLQCAKVGFALAELNPAYAQQAYEYVMERARPAAQAKVNQAPPNDRTAWVVMSDVYALARQMRGIELSSLKAQERQYDSLSPEAKRQLTAEQRQKRLERLSRMVELSRSLAEMESSYAEVLRRLRLIDALEMALQCVEVNPKNAASLRDLASIQALLGDRASAEANYRKALQIAPNDKAAQEGLSRLSAPASQPSTMSTAGQ